MDILQPNHNINNSISNYIDHTTIDMTSIMPANQVASSNHIESSLDRRTVNSARTTETTQGQPHNVLQPDEKTNCKPDVIIDMEPSAHRDRVEADITSRTVDSAKTTKTIKSQSKESKQFQETCLAFTLATIGGIIGTISLIAPAIIDIFMLGGSLPFAVIPLIVQTPFIVPVFVITGAILGRIITISYDQYKNKKSLPFINKEQSVLSNLSNLSKELLNITPQKIIKVIHDIFDPIYDIHFENWELEKMDVSFYASHAATFATLMAIPSTISGIFMSALICTTMPWISLICPVAPILILLAFIIAPFIVGFSMLSVIGGCHYLEKNHLEKKQG